MIHSKNKIACEIMSYLLEHPYAQDTLDGILQWWLLERRIIFQTKKVKEALAELTEKGLLLEQKAGNSHVLYKLNRTKCGEAHSFINNIPEK